MAENAKESVDASVNDANQVKDTKSADAKKGRAKKDTEQKAESVETESAEATAVSSEASATEAAESTLAETEEPEKKPRKTRKTTSKGAKVSAKAATAVADAGEKADDVMREEFSQEEFQTAVREQIENCKNELQVTLSESIRREYATIVKKQLKAANRRRRVGVIVRDLIILILAATVGYFGWCLYDVKYFDWMGPRDVVSSTEQPDQKVEEPEEVVKDTRWYVNNYGYLFEDLQLGLDADSVEAYYLYGDDRKVSEIKPAYLLGMAYNKVMPTAESSTATGASASVAAADLRTAFEGMFGTTEYFEKVGFTHGCKKFTYSRENDSFMTENSDCAVSSKREIVEEIDEMYEEGSVLYVLTTAAIYDAEEASFYNFDNLFKPVVMNAEKEDLAKNRALLNRYQYQFKKTGEKYHFSGVVKLR